MKPSVLTPRVHQVIEFVKEAHPDFVTKKLIAKHDAILPHLAKGCASDLAKFQYYHERKNGSYDCHRGDNPLETWNRFACGPEKGQVATPEMAHFRVLDRAVRYNIDRGIERGLYSTILCNDRSLMDDIVHLYRENASLFDEPVLEDHEPLPASVFNVPLERFGCDDLLDGTFVENLLDEEIQALVNESGSQPEETDGNDGNIPVDVDAHLLSHANAAAALLALASPIENDASSEEFTLNEGKYVLLISWFHLHPHYA